MKSALWGRMNKCSWTTTLWNALLLKETSRQGKSDWGGCGGSGDGRWGGGSGGGGWDGGGGWEVDRQWGGRVERRHGGS